ncbi:MAG: TRAP transporter small permease [Rhizobiales bacterium]|nr:TRAP transporter small permease [Hyphomicrobiales bacterium]
MTLIDRLNRLLGERLCWLYLIAVAVTAYEVVMRYLFNAPTSWAFELTVLMCGICYLLSGGFVTGQKKHIAITALYGLAPPRVRWWLDVVAMIVGIVAMGLLVWAAWKPAVKAVRLVERTGSAWDSPSPAIIKPMIAAGAALIVLQLVVQLVRHIRRKPDPWVEAVGPADRVD